MLSHHGAPIEWNSSSAPLIAGQRAKSVARTHPRGPLLGLHIARASGQVLVIVAPSRAPSTSSALRAASGVFRAGPAFPQTAHHAR